VAQRRKYAAGSRGRACGRRQKSPSSIRLAPILLHVLSAPWAWAPCRCRLPHARVETTLAIFRDSEAIAVATIGWFRNGVDESCALAPNVRMVLSRPISNRRAVPPLAQANGDDLAFLQYTSGSTGHPRGVMLTHQNVVSTIHFMAEAAGITVDDRVVSWLPALPHMGTDRLRVHAAALRHADLAPAPIFATRRQWLRWSRRSGEVSGGRSQIGVPESAGVNAQPISPHVVVERKPRRHAIVDGDPAASAMKWMVDTTFWW